MIFSIVQFAKNQQKKLGDPGNWHKIPSIHNL